MDLFEAIKGRRSIRAYRPDRIPDDVLEKVLDAARWAPSAGNCQPWDLIVVNDSKVKKNLCDAALGQDFIEEAPVVVVICANESRSAQVYGERGRRFYCLLDVAAAVQNLLLAAYALNLGTCWVGAFDDGMVAKVLWLPSGVRPVAIVPLGYPDEAPRPPPRIRLSELVHPNRY